MKEVKESGMGNNIVPTDNPYTTFELGYDVVDLPSEGLFYDKVDGKVVNKAKVYYLTAEDESIMMSPNLMQSGEMLNVLLRKKIVCDIPVDKMLVGDRLALLIYLRTTMEQFYKIKLEDPDTGEMFDYSVDLSTLEFKDISEMPNQDGLYEFMLPKLRKSVKFRLLTGEDEAIITSREKTDLKMGKSNAKLGSIYRLNQAIVAIEGVADAFQKEVFIKNMPLMDSRKLTKYIDEVTPTIKLNIEVPAPSGQNFRINMPITAEFLYPTF